MIKQKKAVTFSYDDGVTQDERLIKILNKYGLKGTFNLNSGKLGESREIIRNGVCINHTKVTPEQVKRIYEGHEVAAHTVSHPSLQDVTDEDIIFQVERDREELSKIVGYEIKGMAYPCCAPDERVIRIVKENTGVKYARSTRVTYNFTPSPDMFEYKGTVYHHDNWDKLFELGKEFLSIEAQTPQIMYIWGHAYEFDIYPERWYQFESFCEMISKRNDIFYGTNIEVFETFGLV